MIDNLSFVFGRGLRHLFHRVAQVDIVILSVVVLISTIGFIALFSASYSMPWRMEDQIRNLAVAALVLFFMMCLPMKALARIAVPLFILGCVLLLMTHLFGITVKGATRWLNVGVRIQPSEIMKLTTPLMLAWYYQKRGEATCLLDHVFALVLLLIPVGFILKQPDLGTAILVAIAGLSVVFFAGLNLKIIVGAVSAFVLSLPLIWTMLHDYQQERILTLLDPSRDPLGKGFHINQALIAIGSGGFWGKGWMEGTQAHLDFIPERTSDFLFAVYSEEFGFVGNVILLILYAILIGRSFYIAAYATNRFSRLLAGAIGSIFFTYTFVNMGMVSGILPVVGVPLPFMSYGGTALMILGICSGILLSISAETQQRSQTK